MKAQAPVICIAAISGMAAGFALYRQNHSTAPVVVNPVKAQLNKIIQDGILTSDTATKLFAEKACYVSEARWMLNADSFDKWKVAWMGLSRDIDFKGKYDHEFVIVYDKDKQPFMALHTMPNDRSDNPLPNAMGDRNCFIDVFPVTMPASNALCEKRGHAEDISPELIRLDNPSRLAGLLGKYMADVKAANIPYTVPVGPVRQELLAALRDNATLADYPETKRGQAMKRRQRARHWIENRDNESLAWWLNPATKYRLGATGFNSNSGAADLMLLLGGRARLQMTRAPFYENSMADEIAARAMRQQKAVKNLKQPTRTEPGSQTGFVPGGLALA